MKRIILGIVLLLVIVLVAIWAMIDGIAKVSVEGGGSYALGVDTRVDDITVSLLKGQVTMDVLNIANPEGYKTDHLMKSGHFEVSLETGSLFSHTVVLPKLTLDGLDINIEQKQLGKTNVSEVMDHAKRLSSDEEKKPSGKKVRIDTVVIKNVVAHVQIVPMGGTVTVKVPTLELKNVTPEDSKGIIVGELLQRLFAAVLASVLENGKDVIPAALRQDLGKDIGELAKALGGDAGKLIGQVGGDFEKLKEGTGKVIKDVGKEAGKVLDDILGDKKKN